MTLILTIIGFGIGYFVGRLVARQQIQKQGKPGTAPTYPEKDKDTPIDYEQPE